MVPRLKLELQSSRVMLEIIARGRHPRVLNNLHCKSEGSIASHEDIPRTATRDGTCEILHLMRKVVFLLIVGTPTGDITGAKCFAPTNLMALQSNGRNTCHIYLIINEWYIDDQKMVTPSGEHNVYTLCTMYEMKVKNVSEILHVL